MGKEALVQAAIMASLEVYADRHGMHTALHAPYANQQGAQLSQLAGDIVGLLAHSTLVLLEVKELDNSSGVPVLPAYDIIQHAANVQLETQLQVPILYAYASHDEMAYFGVSRNTQWPAATLHRTRVTSPSELVATAQIGTNTPDITNHQTLLEWVMFPPASRTSALLAMLFLMGVGIHSLKNSVAILISSQGSIATIPTGTLIKIAADILRDRKWVEELLDSAQSPPGEIKERLTRAREQDQARKQEDEDQKLLERSIREKHGNDKRAAEKEILVARKDRKARDESRAEQVLRDSVRIKQPSSEPGSKKNAPPSSRPS